MDFASPTRRLAVATARVDPSSPLSGVPSDFLILRALHDVLALEMIYKLMRMRMGMILAMRVRRMLPRRLMILWKGNFLQRALLIALAIQT
jgi:hypothetical protein